MIIRNHTSCPACIFKTADNRSQTTVNGPQLTYLNLKLFYLWLVIKKRIVIK
jgi:hypothetical protein